MLNGIVILNLYFKCQLKKKKISFFISANHVKIEILKTRVIRIFKNNSEFFIFHFRKINNFHSHDLSN